MPTADRPTLVLIDGHSLAYRAYFALPVEMATSTGELTNATFGFASMLLYVLDQVRPDYIATAFDLGRTFRHDRYADYKGHRAKSPSELDLQIPRIIELVKTFNIPMFTAEGFEADDILGTLARQAEAQGLKVVIVTGDTDAFQLITEHVTVMTSGHRRFSETTIYDIERIKERYGLTPSQLIDYKALLGDKSDNIPGVSGIGEKTAAPLLQQYGTLEEIYAHLDEIKGRKSTTLAEGRDQAFLSKELVTIRTDVPLTLDREACRTRDFDRGQVVELFRTLEFRSLADRIPQADTPPDTPLVVMEEVPTDYQIVDTPEALRALVQSLTAAGAFTFDTETDSVDPMRATLVGFSFCHEKGLAAYIPIAHRRPSPSTLQPSLEEGAQPEPRNLDLDLVRRELGPLLANPDLALRAHNAKYDLIILRRHNFEITNVDFDTMIAEWLVNPGTRNYGLKGLAWQRLKAEMTEITDLIGTGKHQITFDQVPVDQASQYASADADMTCRLVEPLTQELKERHQWTLFVDVEMPLIPVLATMEMNGIALDASQLVTLSNELKDRLRDLEKEIHTHAGYEFNIASGPQLSEVLFNKLALPTKDITTKTKQGYYSTAVNVLDALKGKHPIIDLILEHRSLQKLLSTYVDQLPQMVNPATGRIHTDYSQIAAETGRLSSSNPNLQNIPARTEVGRRVRRAFVATNGHVLLSADYSQVELRVLAHMSQDPNMLAAFKRGEDIHAATAATILKVDISDVQRNQRDIAKRINFGLLYGMSAWRLAREASIPYEDAEKFLRAYFESFPSIAAYLNKIVDDARDKGYTETLLGRRRYFPELRSDSKVHQNVRAAAERAAKNHPIQGTAADIIKIAMIDVAEALQDFGMQTRMLLQVHDELVFEVPEAELEQAAEMIPRIMSEAYQLDVPLRVDAKVGHNWEEMVSLEDFMEDVPQEPAS